MEKLWNFQERDKKLQDYPEVEYPEPSAVVEIDWTRSPGSGQCKPKLKINRGPLHIDRLLPLQQLQNYKTNFKRDPCFSERKIFLKGCWHSSACGLLSSLARKEKLTTPPSRIGEASSILPHWKKRNRKGQCNPTVKLPGPWFSSFKI